MALVQYGELLSVTSEVVTPSPGATWDAFESKKLLIFDGRQAVEILVGKDLSQEHFLMLKQAADQGERPRIALEVSLFKTRLYANKLVQMDDQTLSSVA